VYIYKKYQLLYIYSIPPDDGLQICPKHVEVDLRNKLRINKCYICSSVRRNSRLKESNKMKLYAGIYLLLNCSSCFGRPSHPSSGVHKTVVAASGTDHTIWGASFFKCDQI